MTDREDLALLARRWYDARWHTFWTVRRRFERVPVPSALAGMITDREPYRSQVLIDAGYWVSLFCPMGLDPVVEIGEFAVGPHAPWAAAVRRLAYAVTTLDAMAACAAPISTVHETFELVVREETVWKVAQVWSPAERASVLAALPGIRERWPTSRAVRPSNR